MENFVSTGTLSACGNRRARGLFQELPAIDEVEITSSSAYTSGRARRNFDIYRDRYFLLKADDSIICVIWKDENDAIMEKKFKVKKEQKLYFIEQQSALNQRPLSHPEFIKLCKDLNSNLVDEELYRAIQFRIDGVLTDLYNETDPHLGNESAITRQETKKFLQANKINTYEDLCNFQRNRMKKYVTSTVRVFRTLRPIEYQELEEDEHLALKPKGLWPVTEEVSQYCKALQEHVAGGTRAVLPSRFLSTTGSLSLTLWWSMGGLSGIACVELGSLTAEANGPLFWVLDSDSGDNDVLGHRVMAENFAKSSQEVVFDGMIPREHFTLLQIKWQNPHVYFTDEHNGFPKLPQKAFNPSSIFTIEKTLEGSTIPLKVKCGGEAYIMKRVGQKGADEFRHLTAEFFSLLMYRLMEVKVPSAALYNVTVTLNGTSPRPFWFLLIKYIEGSTPNMRQGKNIVEAEIEAVSKDLFADVILANFDVCGVSHANLISSSSEIYRIDGGGCLDYQPVGKRLKRATKFGCVKTDLMNFTKKPKGKEGRSPHASYLRWKLFDSAGFSDSQGVPESAAKLMEKLAMLMKRRNLSAEGLLASFRTWMLKITRKNPVLPDWCEYIRTVEQRVREIESFLPDDFQTSLHPSGQLLVDLEPYWDQVLVLKKRYRNQQADQIPQGYLSIDVTSLGGSDWSTLSPFYKTDYCRINVPGKFNIKAKCVEDIWQGLKFGGEKNPVDMEMLMGNKGPAKKRRIPNIIGHDYNGKVLDKFQARLKIYLPAYLQHLEWDECKKLVEKLRKLIIEREGKIALLDIHKNCIWHDGPMSHARLLKNFLFFNDLHPPYAEVEFAKWYTQGEWADPYKRCKRRKTTQDTKLFFFASMP